jgi:hypothetical protein
MVAMSDDEPDTEGDREDQPNEASGGRPARRLREFLRQTYGDEDAGSPAGGSAENQESSETYEEEPMPPTPDRPREE